MNMQHMHMDNLHKVFWRDDQVTVLFRSDLPLVIGGVLNQEPLQQFSAPAQLKVLNAFLQEKEIRGYTLQLLDGGNQPSPPPPPQDMSKRSSRIDNFGLPPGIYPFGFTTPIELPQGDKISTSFVSFFRIEKSPSQPGSGDTAMEMPDSGDNGDSHDRGSHVSTIVKTFNEHLDELNKELISQGYLPVTITAPNYITGGTPVDGGQGCPLTPPIPLPVTDSCSNWHIELPDLHPPDLKSKTGNGVTVFILDSFPERGAIARAAQDAGDDNLLLRKVKETVEFDYSFMSGIQDVQEMGETQSTFVGKDVYGRHYPILLADHGLFIAGIVRDVAPDARIECIRVLDDLCVGDVQVIADALWSIYYRNAFSLGDLYGKEVVVNLSLVIPTDDEVNSKGVNTTIGGSNNVWSSLKQPLRSLSELGVIIVASAGNEADLREMPGGNRPNALHPADFGNFPEYIEGVIPVGALDGKGKATSYSCYPGIRGIATYGGEVPDVQPPSPPNPTSNHPVVNTSDALRGIYSSADYPPLSLDPPAQYYTAPNDHAWAYWVGTSFATPIISALAARILEKKKADTIVGTVRDNVLRAASGTTAWDRLSSVAGGAASGTEDGRVIHAVQLCIATDHDDEDVKDEVEMEVEITEINVTINELNG